MEQVFIELRKLHAVSSQLELYLRNHILKRLCRKGEIFLKEGDICRGVYFIERGLIHHFSTKSGKNVSTWLLAENDFCVSFESFFNRIAAEDNIQALEDCILWYITFEQLQEISRLFPEFKLHVMLIEQKYRSISEKIKRELYGLGPEEKYLWFLSYHANIANRVPIEIIWSYLGISRNTFDTIRRKMARRSNPRP